MSEIEQKVQQLFSYAEYDYSFFDNIVEILKWFDKVEVKIETDGVKRQETLLFYKGKLRVEEWEFNYNVSQFETIKDVLAKANLM